MPTIEEEALASAKTAPEDDNKILEATAGTKSDLADNFYRRVKEMEKEFTTMFGKNPTEEEVVAKFQEKNPTTFKDKSYPEILDILKNGIKDKDETRDPSSKDRNLHDWLQDHVGKETPKDDKEKETTIVEKKKELLDENEEPKLEITKEIPATKTEKNNEDEIIPTKKKGGFWNKTGRAIARPFKKTRQAAKRTGRTSRKIAKGTAKTTVSLVKGVAKTVRTPVGLTSYLLSDIGIKDKSKRTGWKDRWAGYKKHRARTKKAI